MEKIEYDGNYFMYALLDLEPVKRFPSLECRSDTHVLGSADESTIQSIMKLQETFLR